MGALNWKDDAGGGSEARASRAIGGRYRITCWRGGDKTWFGAIEETTYEIRYRPNSSHNWQPVRHPRGTPGTLAEAKQMAEEDHARRLRELESEEVNDDRAKAVAQ
jgi:hypothetical protein